MGRTISGMPDHLFEVYRIAGTNDHRFEAFDEPWKVEFNKPGRAWEDKWGLMDPARKLKKGLKIPDCDGKTAS